VVEYESSELDSVRLILEGGELDTTVVVDESEIIVCLECQEVESYTFFLSDPSMMDCEDIFALDSIECPETCVISEVEITDIVCTSDTTINFQIDFFFADVSSDFFDIIDESGDVVFTGRYDAVPLTVEDFTYPGPGFFSVIVADNDNSSCRSRGITIAPLCVFNCSYDIEIASIACDSTNLTSRIFVSCVGMADSFAVTFGGVDQGVYSCDVGFIDLGPIFPGSDLFAHIVVQSLSDTACREVVTVTNACVNGFCDLRDLVAEPYGCTDDEYLIDIDLISEDVGSDSCIIQIGDDIIGTFAYDDRPFTLGPFPDRGAEELRIVVTDQIFEYCTEFTEVEWEGCPRDSCEENITIISTTCDGDDAFVLVQLDCEDTLYSYSIVYGEFDELMITGTCSDTTVLISLRLTDYTGTSIDFTASYWSTTGDTCVSNRSVPNPCRGCEVESLTVTDVECDSNGLLIFTVDVVHSEPGGTSVTILGNFREDLGTYLLSDFPIRLRGVTPRDSDDQFLGVFRDDDCSVEIEFPTPDCLANPCPDQDFIISVGQCEDREVQLIIVGEGLLSEGNYEVFIDEELQGTLADDEFPFISRPIIAVGQIVTVVLVLTTPDGEICEYIERYELPTCTVSTTDHSLQELTIISGLNDLQILWSDPVMVDEHIVVYDLCGRVVATARLTSGNRTITLLMPQTAVGLYFIHVVGKGTRKIIR